MLSALAGLAYLPVGVPTIPDQIGVVAGNSSDNVIDVHTGRRHASMAGAMPPIVVFCPRGGISNRIQCAQNGLRLAASVGRSAVLAPWPVSRRSGLQIQNPFEVWFDRVKTAHG